MNENQTGNLFTVCEPHPIARPPRPTGPRNIVDPNEQWRENERAYRTKLHVH